LQVTRSGFYAWQRRPESAHARRDRHLRVRVRASHDASRRAYGRPRIWKDLVEAGERVSEKRVGRLMREEGIVARARRRFKVTTMSDHDQPVAANVLDRRFTADRPNQRWVGDTSEFLVGRGTKLFVAAILDLYSRYVVGWGVSAVNDRHLTIKALEMAIKRRCPEAGLLHHSDQGCTYASEDYQRWLTTHGITCSMSRRGNCYDNAVMESFFSTVKFELGEHFDSCGEAKMQLFDYIEVFYNQRRRHSTIGLVSPAAFERAATISRVDAIDVDASRTTGRAKAGSTAPDASWGILSSRAGVDSRAERDARRTSMTPSLTRASTCSAVNDRRAPAQCGGARRLQRFTIDPHLTAAERLQYVHRPEQKAVKSSATIVS
jgi:transposase InsO family protein